MIRAGDVDKVSSFRLFQVSLSAGRPVKVTGASYWAQCPTNFSVSSDQVVLSSGGYATRCAAGL